MRKSGFTPFNASISLNILCPDLSTSPVKIYLMTPEEVAQVETDFYNN